MPIGFDPADTCEITLDCIDKGKPDDQRAKFRCRFLTSGQVRKIDLMREAANKSSSDTDADNILNDAIMLGIVGWSGIVVDGKPLEFSREALDEFTPTQKYRIVYEYPFRVGLQESDRKN